MLSNEDLIECGVKMNESLHTIETTGKRKNKKECLPHLSQEEHVRVTIIAG